ncbi:MAG: Gx transporter family protein [Clostridiales bacterium]|nr:Gx transporter family protein [Clostridiales bacterium]
MIFTIDKSIFLFYNEPMKTKRLVLCGLLTALMLVLGYVESLIPIPSAVPGIKLGLANSVLLYALYMLNLPTAWLLMVLKVVLSALLFGGVNTMLFSLAGGVVSMLGMCLLKKMQGISPVVISAVGGMLHNVGQVLMAMLLLHTTGLLGYMAVLMAVGLITGIVTGIAANLTMGHLKHLK